MLQRVEADARARPLAAAGALFFDDDGQLLSETWYLENGNRT